MAKVVKPVNPAQLPMFDAPVLAGPTAMVRLKVLRGEVERCTLCELHKDRIRSVFGEGKWDKPVIAFIGEAPGAQEDQQGRPFVGASGQFLNRLIGCLGLKREDVYITNMVSCFPGSVALDAHDIERGYRRWYEGELVEIQTGDNQLTGTPNHPVLTARGWVPLGEIAEGDEVVRGRLRKEMAGRDPHVHHGPRRADELFRALALESVCERVVGRDVDFHGDGRQGEIEVVRPDSQLRHRGETALLQPAPENVLSGPLHDARSLKALRAELAATSNPLGRERNPTNSGVSGLRELLSAFRSGSVETETHRIALVPQDNASVADRRSEATLADVELLRESLQSIASNVTLDKVRHVRRIAFAGHVHNLQTSRGWYTANGLIVSNCRPPKNRTPTAAELLACRPHWLAQIEAVQPQVIVALGKTAASVLTAKSETMYRLRGKWWTWKGIPLRVTWHPSYVLRTDEDRWGKARQQVWDDMVEVAQRLNLEIPKSVLDRVAAMKEALEDDGAEPEPEPDLLAPETADGPVEAFDDDKACDNDALIPLPDLPAPLPVDNPVF